MMTKKLIDRQKFIPYEKVCQKVNQNDCLKRKCHRLILWCIMRVICFILN